MSKKYHCNLCNVGFNFPNQFRAHNETEKHKENLELPTQTNHDNIVLKEQQDIERLNKKKELLEYNTNLKLDEMMSMLTQVINQTKYRAKPRVHEPTDKPIGSIYIDGIMNYTMETSSEFRRNPSEKANRDGEDAYESFLNFDNENIKDTDCDARWSGLYFDLRKETNYDNQLELCSEFMLENFMSSDDFFIECESPMRMRFITEKSGEKEWYTSQASKKIFTDDVKIVIKILQGIEKVHEQLLKKRDRHDEFVSTMDIFNEIFSVEYLYDKIIQKEL